MIFLSGLYLAVSPWVVGFDTMTTLTVNNLITGIALATLAVGFASAYGRTHGVAWVTPLIGVWTIIAPWVVAGATATTSTIWNNVVTGAVAVVFGLAATSIGLLSKR
ncbi:MAG TPA: SPW repeat protein [Streptosporangiaceae bacterium]